MAIEDFDSLLMAARQQPEPQRLLFMLLKVESEAPGPEGEPGGTLEPLMCVDKAPEELTSFAALVEEADTIRADWQIMLVAALAGQGGKAPEAAAVDRALQMMTHKIETGGDLSRYLAFDRDGAPIQFT